MLYAISYSRYLALHGATREHMATFIVNNRHNATLNPHSVFKDRPLTRDDYLNDRIFAEPFSYLDADMGVDGAGAVLLTTADRALDLRQQPAYIVGHASVGVDTWNSPLRPLESIRECAGYVADSLWEATGLTPADIDQPNLYDGYSFLTYLWLEALGFCGVGEAFEFIQDGRIALDGELPLNTSGGSLGMGRLHGPPQVIESVLQLQGRAGARQVPNPRITLAQTGSTFAAAGAMILTNDATV
jgi:acetyl-CoA acetyltransferase